MTAGPTTTADERIADLLARALPPDRPELAATLRRARETIAALAFRERRRGGEALPRLRLLCGPSGGGKSSLFNAVLRLDASRTSSVERPATRGVVCGLGGDARADDLMPTLARVGSEAPPGSIAGSFRSVEAKELDFGVLVDAPDYDSREVQNRALIEAILPWADEVVFVTSLERYADRSASEVLGRIARLGTPFVAILNKLEGEGADVLNDFASKLATMGAAEPRRIGGLLLREGGIDPAAYEVVRLRGATAADGPDDVALRRELNDLLENRILVELRAWKDELGILDEELRAILPTEAALRGDDSVSRLERYEDGTRFWLRYSPRGVLRGLKEILRDPGMMFRGSEMPEEIERDPLLGLVLGQARERRERLRIRARETMKRSRIGRLLIAADDFGATEPGDAELERGMTPIAEDLHRFGHERLETFRREWSKHRQTMMGRARIWAIDKVLRLLTLCLTLAVLPPLVWELLRFIGHPSFTNAVTAKFEDARGEFDAVMQRLESAQIDRYLEAARRLGPDEALVDDLESLMKVTSGTGTEG